MEAEPQSGLVLSCLVRNIFANILGSHTHQEKVVLNKKDGIFMTSWTAICGKLSLTGGALRCSSGGKRIKAGYAA